MPKLLALALAAATPVFAGITEAPIPAKVEYNRDVRPILSDACFRCHGFDKNHRKADLRLDERDAAIRKIDDIYPLVPGKPTESEVWRRIIATDADEIMPPPKETRQLSAREKEILKRWIEQGAEYQAHWAYIAPERPGVPKVEEPGFTRTDIDRFALARQKSLALAHVGEADRATLIRRLSLDLHGIPPKPEDVAAFVADPAPDAYEKLVDRLLASPRYGERMAVWWLDLVRYADTIGYHSDNPRNVWPYRDWVIKAFNDNKRFDQFTIEQLAGDLMPEATLQTKVASTFNPLNLSTEEGGAQAKQYEAKTVTDRVKAVGTVWLAQTYMCGECHDHKYDPFTTRDFYSLGAFFADIKENAIGRREDGMIVAGDDVLAKLKEYDTKVAAARKTLDERLKITEPERPLWEADLTELIAAVPTKHGVPTDVVAALKVERTKRNAKQKKAVDDYWESIHPLLTKKSQALKKAEDERKAFYDPLPKTLATVSTGEFGQFRTVRILPRGDFMNETGAVVQPATPEYITEHCDCEDETQRLTRLDLAKWLMARQNPLTARVFVNRLWKQFYGIGLSKTLDDLGLQGEMPPNIALLDWLACEFMDRGWDIKHMVRLMVTSGVYRQSSVPTTALAQADPLNRELTRGARWRLDAEFLRDNALAVSGLLVEKLGGPSVKPYQPAGYWENLNFPVREWQNDRDENQWRRGLYTWWQRSYLHPALVALDAPSREECIAERTRSNIPQQALVLLNDPTYVEAARAFAVRMLEQGGTDAAGRLAWAWQQATQRDPNADEAALLGSLLDKHLTLFKQDSAAAKQLLGVGYKTAPANLDPAELAAYTSVARALLNMHETITRN